MDGDYVASLLMGSGGLDFGVPGLDSGFFDTLCGGAGGGFGERAAGMHGSGFGTQFGMPDGSCGELGAASREGSSVSDPAWAYGANAKKRKAPAGKGKEAAACFAKVGEATGPDSKRCKIEEGPVRPKVEEEAAGAASDGPAGGERGRQQAKGKSSKSKQAADEPPRDYVHVRARRGQATDSHSLAERVRREKITLKMKFLQDLVPGCNKVIGKALMLDEIINYVQSLQQQVEFLSMKLSTVNPQLDFSTLSSLLHKDMHQALGPSESSVFPLESAGGVLPFCDQGDLFQSFSSGAMGSMGLLDMALPHAAASTQYGFQKQHQNFWEENLQNAPHIDNEQSQENGVSVSALNFDGHLQGADHAEVEF